MACTIYHGSAALFPSSARWHKQAIQGQKGGSQHKLTWRLFALLLIAFVHFAHGHRWHKLPIIDISTTIGMVLF